MLDATDKIGKVLTAVDYLAAAEKIRKGYQTGNDQMAMEGVKDLVKNVGKTAAVEIATKVGGPAVGTVTALGIMTFEQGYAAGANIMDFTEYRGETAKLTEDYGSQLQRATIFKDIYEDKKAEYTAAHPGPIPPEELERMKESSSRIADGFMDGDKAAVGLVEKRYGQMGKEVPSKETMRRTWEEALEQTKGDFKEALVNVGVGLKKNITAAGNFLTEDPTRYLANKIEGVSDPGKSAAEREGAEDLAAYLQLNYDIDGPTAKKLAEDIYKTGSKEARDNLHEAIGNAEERQKELEKWVEDYLEKQKAEEAAREEKEKSEAALQRLKDKIAESKKEPEEEKPDQDEKDLDEGKNEESGEGVDEKEKQDGEAAETAEGKEEQDGETAEQPEANPAGEEPESVLDNGTNGVESPTGETGGAEGARTGEDKTAVEEGADGKDDEEDGDTDKEDDEDDDEDSEDDNDEDASDDSAGDADSLREAEGGSLPPAGNDGSVADEPDGGSIGGFVKDRESDRADAASADNASSTLVNNERNQESANNQNADKVRVVLDQGGDAANTINRESSAQTAADQTRNSWATAIGDGIQQAAEQGVSSLGSSFGGAVGDNLGERAASSIFDNDWRPHGDSKGDAGPDLTSVGATSSSGGSIPASGASLPPSGGASSPSGGGGVSSTSGHQITLVAKPGSQASAGSPSKTSGTKKTGGSKKPGTKKDNGKNGKDFELPKFKEILCPKCRKPIETGTFKWGYDGKSMYHTGCLEGNGGSPGKVTTAPSQTSKNSSQGASKTKLPRGAHIQCGGKGMFKEVKYADDYKGVKPVYKCSNCGFFLTRENPMFNGIMQQ